MFSMILFLGMIGAPQIILIVVVVLPFGPSNPNTSPRFTSKSTLLTAFALGRPQKSLNTFVRPRTEITTSPACSVFDREENASCVLGLTICILYIELYRRLKNGLKRVARKVLALPIEIQELLLFHPQETAPIPHLVERA